jgi:hypothetical protein
MRSPIQQCIDEANRQIAELRLARLANPDAFGSRHGCFDQTPEHGPMLLPIVYETAEGWRWRVLWGVHKHPWPLTFIYCLGRASDSRGERSDPGLIFDLRKLPKKYLGRFNLDRDPGCARASHRTIIARALADGFDLTTITEDAR